MYVYLSKILPIFVMPLTIALALGLVALFLLRRKRRRWAGGLLALAIVLLWVASTPFAARVVYGSLEARYPAVPASELPQAGCVVVLGGVMSGALPPRVNVELHDSIDRVFKALEVYQAGKARFIVVTGGNQPWSKDTLSEAEMIRDLLEGWGVPRKSIILEGSSRNTRENALYTRNAMASINCQEALLVTSAAHMPRAMAAFQAAGVAVTPVSTDVRVADTGRLGVLDFLPDAGALQMTSDGLREWVGQWVYRWQGWN
jgi:uncharacterized SAM-binding protein YcdF (DUF218 family)